MHREAICAVFVAAVAVVAVLVSAVVCLSLVFRLLFLPHFDVFKHLYKLIQSFLYKFDLKLIFLPPFSPSVLKPCFYLIL